MHFLHTYTHRDMDIHTHIPLHTHTLIKVNSAASFAKLQLELQLCFNAFCSPWQLDMPFTGKD